MAKSVWIGAICVVIALGGAGSASAKTPDGKPPSQETICDNEHGAAFGLCNAYCEAMDCTDPNQHASDRGCEQVKANFMKKTGRPLPCDVTCPCGKTLQLFADIESGAAVVQQCVMTDTSLFVQVDTGDFAIINSETPSCNVNGEGVFVPLTDAELLACRITLQRAVTAQAIVCIFVE
jgi:hypothetical protein